MCSRLGTRLLASASFQVVVQVLSFISPHPERKTPAEDRSGGLYRRMLSGIHLFQLGALVGDTREPVLQLGHPLYRQPADRGSLGFRISLQGSISSHGFTF